MSIADNRSALDAFLASADQLLAEVAQSAVSKPPADQSVHLARARAVERRIRRVAFDLRLDVPKDWAGSTEAGVTVALGTKDADWFVRQLEDVADWLTSVEVGEPGPGQGRLFE